jgi:RNA methyltransferase, TrmH family
LEKISTLQTPNKVLAIVEQPKFEADFSKLSLYLYLDNIKDPGNLGTIIRTAEWFGLSHIFLSPECVEYYNPKVVQSSMGSIFRMQLTNISLLDLQREVQPKATYGAVLGGNVVEGMHWETPCILVIGSESHGIGTENKKHLTEGISISAYGQTESLNAAIACGILLYSFKQQPG